MDWPSMILITYAFLLALLLAVLIMRSVNSSRRRYQKLLEEKEQRLSAIQLDLEETMDSLGDQAAALELTLQEADRRENAANQALQQRLLEVQGAVVSAQSRLMRLEQGMEEMRRAAALPAGGIEISAEDPEALPELPQSREEVVERQDDAPEEQPRETGADEMPPQEAEKPEGQESEKPVREKKPRRKKAEKQEEKKLEQAAQAMESAEAEQEAEQAPEAEGQEWEDDGIRKMLVTLFEHGGTVAEAARAAGCSSVEASMIYNQWKRGYFSQNVPGR